MARGAPDFFRVVQIDISNTFSAVDELAARLGAVTRWHRGGAVLFIDDMRDGLMNYIVTTNAVGSSVALDTSIAYNSSQSIKLTYGDNANARASIEKTLKFTGSKKVGLECIFAPEVNTDYILLDLYVTIAGVQHQMTINFEQPLSRISYEDDGGLPVKIDDYTAVNYTYPTWNSAKLIFDVESEIMDSLIFNGTVYELGIAVQTAANVGLDEIRFLVRAQRSVAGTQSINVGGIILTINE